MATKGMKNLLRRLFNKTKQPPAKKDPENISFSRRREKELIARLQAIGLDDPHRQLSAAKIMELNIPNVIRYACNELKFPLTADQNIVNLDNNMKYIIDVLEEAIKMGREMTAEWTCAALICAINALRANFPAVNQEYADALMECRVEYTGNLKLLVQLCRERDILAENLEAQHRRCEQKRKALDSLKEHYLSRRNSGALDTALVHLQQFIDTPAEMGDEALALRDELSQIHLYKASLIEIEISINAGQVTLNNRDAQIKSHCNDLYNPPHVTDPELPDHSDEANRNHRELLRRVQNDAEEAIRFHSRPDQMTFAELTNIDDL